MQRVTSRRPVLLQRIFAATAATFALCQAGKAGEVWVPAKAPQISDTLASRVFDRYAASDVLRVWPAGETLMGCFIDGRQQERQLVVEAAEEWARHANLRFDFGPGPDHRPCPTTAPFPVIRVLLKAGSTSTAYNGVTALQTRAPGQTVTIATLGPRAPVPVIRGDLYPTILHELGHVLGLKHEHQHPESPCFMNFKFETICRITPLFEGKAPTDIARTIELAYAPRVHPIPGRYASGHPYDPASIMHYKFAPRELIDPAVACGIRQSHTTISEVDKARVRKLYPATRAEQERMIMAEAAVLARLIAATPGLSPAGQVRVAAEAERTVRLGHPALDFKVPLPARHVTPEPKNGAESLQSVALRGVLPLVDTCKLGIDARTQPKQPPVPIAPSSAAPPAKAP